MEELLDWVEKNALENLRFRLQNAETLAKDASATLTLVLTAMGGALAYAVRGLKAELLMPWSQVPCLQLHGLEFVRF